MSGPQIDPYTAPKQLGTESGESIHHATWCRMWRSLDARANDLANQALLIVILIFVLDTVAVCLFVMPSFKEMFSIYSESRITTLRIEIAYGVMIMFAFAFLADRIKRRRINAIRLLIYAAYVAILVAIAMTVLQLWVFLSYFVAVFAIDIPVRGHRILRLSRMLQNHDGSTTAKNYENHPI